MRYSIIYADPPWTFKTYSERGKGRSAERHYPCMSLEEIKRLRVEDISSDDSVLFLWVTFPMLEKAFEVIESWGFTYKSLAFCWVKQNKKSDSLFWGLGYWTRQNPEICLLCTRGNPKRVSGGVHSVVLSRIERHSKKPDEVRDRIVKLCGDLPRIELFAREISPGWDVWGDEVVQDAVEVKL